MTFKEDVKNFIKNLKDFKKTNDDSFFNPWAEKDKYDINDNQSATRCSNLEKYLMVRKNAKYVLIAEAPGYQGCHFSGIPMTSERIFETNKYGFNDEYKRTSDKNKLKGAKLGTGKPVSKKVIRNGFSEPTATIVWKQMIDELNLKPIDFVLWNSFPFHPYKDDCKLSNRKPTPKELERTKKILENFLELWKNASIIAVGNVAKETLKVKEYAVSLEIRHPAFGGAREFREKIKKFIEK